MNLCDECQRLRGQYQTTADRLAAAQRDLANYELLRNSDFVHLWDESESALKELWHMREKMMAHAATHQEGVMSTHAEAP
jgi:hypothetical protein